MKIILKKIVGVLFILMGGLLSLSLLIQAPKTITNAFERKAVSGYGFGYISGVVIGFLIFIVIIFFLFKFGLKWTSNTTKPKKREGIDSIGE